MRILSDNPEFVRTREMVGGRNGPEEMVTLNREAVIQDMANRGVSREQYMATVERLKQATGVDFTSRDVLEGLPYQDEIDTPIGFQPEQIPETPSGVAPVELGAATRLKPIEDVVVEKMSRDVTSGRIDPIEAERVREATNATVSPRPRMVEGRVYIGDIDPERRRDPSEKLRSEIVNDRFVLDQMQAATDQLRMRDESLARFMKSKSASTGEIWSAAFTTENTLGAWFANEAKPIFPAVPSYDPFEISPEDGSSDLDGYEQFAQLFTFSKSPDETQFIKTKIDREVRNRRVLEEHGFHGFVASLAAGITDPINLITMAIPVAQGARLPTLMAFAAGSAAATEVGLQAMQETRTIEESIANTVGSALLSGALGKLATSLTKRQKDAIIKDMADIMTDAPRSVGAAQVGVTGAKPIIEGPLAYVAAIMTKVTPLGRTIQSQLASVRSAAQRLVESNIRLSDDYVPTSAEALIRRDYANMDTAIVRVRQLMKDSGMSPADFNSTLVRAMRRGDQSSNPQVEQAAKILREQVDGIWQRAYDQNLGGTWRMTPDGEGGEVREMVTSSTAPSYMTRRYDLNAVRTNPVGFKNAWARAIAEQRVREGQPALDADEMSEVVNDIYEKISNLRDGDLHWNVGPSGAAMLAKRVDVRDEFLEDFLVNDWEALMHSYVKSLSPRVRIAELFGAGSGEFDMKAVIDGIKDEYMGRIAKLDAEISAVHKRGDSTGLRNKLIRKRDDLAKQMQSDVRDIEVMRDRLLNVNQEPSWMNPENRGVLSALRGMRSWNIVTSLSNIVLSSVPDLARVITYHGGMKAMRAFAKSAFTRDLKRSNMPKDHLAKIASAMERASSYRLSNFTEVEDGVVYTSFDKYAHKAADMVLTASGSKHWNSTMKTMVGYLASDKIGMALSRGNASDIALLKRMGLTDEAIKVAQAEAAKHATKEDGMWSLNIERWGHLDVIENIEAAVIKEANSVVVTPSAGDKPLIMTTEMGRTIGQFLSFAVSSTNKMTLPLMQEGTARSWLEIMTHLTLGAGVYVLRQKMADKEISDRPEVIIAEAFDKTGVAGYGAALMKAGAGLTGVSPFSDEGHFYQHNGISKVLGPSAGLVENILRVPNVETSPEQRAKSLRKLMPMQNHFLLRKGYDQIEEKAAELMGAQSSPNF